MKKGMFLLVLLFVIAGMWVSSCTQNKPTGLIGPGRIPLTPTPTLTPDVNFSVLIHQEGTPVNDVNVTLYCHEKGIEQQQKTADGAVGYKISEYGIYYIGVDSFDGFKAQVFQVDPFGNTLFAVDYGIPKLELELMDGDETIMLMSQNEGDNVLDYKITYRTKFEREEEVDFDKKEILEPEWQSEKIVSKDGDEVRFRIQIPDNFEGYDSPDSERINNRELRFRAVMKRDTENNTKSNERTLKKGWSFYFKTKFDLIQLYHYNFYNSRVLYYTGVSVLDKSLKAPGYMNGEINYEIIDAGTWGDDGSGACTTISNCEMPNWTGYGCYTVLGRRNSGRELDKWKFKNNNDGYIKIRIYDVNGLDIEREFNSVGKGWSTACFNWCCTSGDPFLDKNKYKCAADMNMGTCGLWFDTPKMYRMYRKKSVILETNY